MNKKIMIEDSVRKHLSELGRKGGKSTSPRKIEAARQNALKASKVAAEKRKLLALLNQAKKEYYFNKDRTITYQQPTV